MKTKYLACKKVKFTKCVHLIKYYQAKQKKAWPAIRIIKN